MKEIERKFLVKDLPNLAAKPILSVKITQQYLAVGNEEIRVRKEEYDKSNFYILCVKKGNGMVRSEKNFAITSETFEQMYNTGKKPIVKTRTKYKWYDYTIEMDVYEEDVPSVYEVEFHSEEQAMKFEVPSFFGEEVTDDKSYKNQNIWKRLNNL